MRKKWSLGNTGWAVCNGKPVFYIELMHDYGGEQGNRAIRMKVIHALNRNEGWV